MENNKLLKDEELNKVAGGAGTKKAGYKKIDKARDANNREICVGTVVAYDPYLQKDIGVISDIYTYTDNTLWYSRTLTACTIELFGGGKIDPYVSNVYYVAKDYTDYFLNRRLG